MRAQEFLAEDEPARIKLGAGNATARAWITKVYARYPHTFNNNHVMSWGEGDDQELAMFELEPSMTKRGAVEVKWFQAYPLRQGIGSRAMKELQDMAREDGISLTLFPWDKGRISQAKLMKFYRLAGFKPIARGGKSMAWTPEQPGLAEVSLNESAVFLNPTTVIVGQAHGQPLDLSPDTLKKVQAIAVKHGAYYEGNGTDRSYTKGQIDRYTGSWDDEVAKTASPNDPKWLYVLFANVDENNRVQRVGVDPKDTIFNRLLATAQDNSFQGIGYTARALQKFLQMASEGQYDFVKMSQQPATQPNLTRFLKAGEALMWPSNWEQYPNQAGKIAKAATVDVRDQYLATRKAGVYVTGSGHLKAVQNITGQQAMTEGLRVDVPNEEWLNDAVAYAKEKSPDRNGLPYMGKTTATVRQVEVPVMLLRRIPGMRNEQQNVRQADLAAIMKIMKDTGKLPLHTHTGEEYKPFINVAYDGSAWVNEGNHRIMAAYRLGFKTLPVEISYFDGGERIESGPMYPGKIGL